MCPLKSGNNIHVNDRFILKKFRSSRGKSKATQELGRQGARNSIVYKQWSQNCFSVEGNRLTFCSLTNKTRGATASNSKQTCDVKFRLLEI